MVELSPLYLFVWYVKYGSHVGYYDDLEENQIFYLMDIGPFFFFFF